MVADPDRIHAVTVSLDRGTRRHVAKDREVLRALLLSLFPQGFEEREQGRTYAFIVYAEDLEGLRATEASVLSELAACEHVFVSVPRVSAETRDAPWRDRWTQHLDRQALTPSITIELVDAELEANGSEEPEAARPGIIRLVRRGAFGFGEHPSTRLAAVALEDALEERAEPEVLDLGCGTGVLAILAALRGRGRAMGIDIDPESVQIAADNARHNGVGSRCRFERRTIDELEMRAPLVVANLELPVLLAQSRAIAGAVGRAGRLIVSGFLAEQGATVEHAFAVHGLGRRSALEEGEWGLLVLQSSATDPG